MAATISFAATNTSGSVTINNGQVWTGLTADQQSAVNALCHTLFGVYYGVATETQRAFALLRYGIDGYYTMNPGSSRFED